MSYDERGRVDIGHAGAFYLGASTYVNLIPGEDLGIAVLTNGEPIGVPEGIARSFLDIAEHGRQTVYWFALFGRVFDAMRAADAAPFDGYDERPRDARTQATEIAASGTHSEDHASVMPPPCAGSVLCAIG